MGDLGLSKIRKGKQCLVRHFAHFAYGLQAGSEQSVLYPRWELDFTDWRVIRKLWRGLKFVISSSPSARRISTSAENRTCSILSHCSQRY